MKALVILGLAALSWAVVIGSCVGINALIH